MYLIPTVKSLEIDEDIYVLHEASAIILECENNATHLLGAEQIAKELSKYCALQVRTLRRLNDDHADIRLRVDPQLNHSYTININDQGVELSGADSAGLFYACQTLRQIIRQHGRQIPHLIINDKPDFAARGLYYDITRGKVPTYDTLCEIVERCSFYKINQLQLYIEHTFDFQKYTGIAAGKSPITAEEILKLDELCLKHHIDLVPSMTTFGHCYEILRSKRLEHLCELDVKGSDYPYSWFDRQAHYTLDSTNPDSIKLVHDLLDEYLPLFSSKFFNICCDETIDLEVGKNKAAGHDTAELYLNFTKQVIQAVIERGRKPQMWGDILLEHPEHISDLPKECTVLNWSYSPDCASGPCEPFEKAGLPYYVCPGTSAWSQFFAQIDNASQNIMTFAERGKKHGACGLLNTDWGDHGHPGLLGCSLHGQILGAQCAWDADPKNNDNFDQAFSVIELNDRSEQAAALMRSFSKELKLRNVELDMQFDPDNDIPILATWNQGKIDAMNRLKKEGFREDEHYAEAAAEMCKIRSQFIQCLHQAGQLHSDRCQDMVVGMWGEILMHEAAHLIQCHNGVRDDQCGLDYFQTADALRRFEQLLSDRWHADNKPSEYFRLQEFLCTLADQLDSCQVAKV